MNKGSPFGNDYSMQPIELRSAALEQIRGGIGPGVDPGNSIGPGIEPGSPRSEIGPGAEPGSELGPGAEPGSP